VNESTLAHTVGELAGQPAQSPAQVQAARATARTDRALADAPKGNLSVAEKSLQEHRERVARLEKEAAASKAQTLAEFRASPAPLDVQGSLRGSGVETRTAASPSIERYTLSPNACTSSAVIKSSFESIYHRGVWSGQAIHKETPSYFYYYSNPARWKSRVSASGHGSDTGVATLNSLSFVVGAIQEFRIETMLDIPCGDVNWMMDAFETDSLHYYVGADITPSVIKLNKQRFNHHSNKAFTLWDLASCKLPRLRNPASNSSRPFDLIHVRDVLQHLPLKAGGQAAQHILRSGARFVISTTFDGEASNRNIGAGDYYRNNLQHAPFNFPKPLRCVKTHPSLEGDSTCLWRLGSGVQGAGGVPGGSGSKGGGA